MNCALCSMRCSCGAASSCTNWACWRNLSNWASLTACLAVSSAIALEAIAGRRRKSVVTTAATASSVARSWIASTFSWTLSGKSTFQPTTRFALSCVHLGEPPRRLGRGLLTVSKRSCSSGMLARVLWIVWETSARRCSFGQREDTHR
ncbi:hypothetical protein STSP_38250 [Streptomyces jeddahensis]|uniref:Secreted protein n=1 Tax=Streptomyces jeddahensis TaxID=1716141 RepID=A0A177HRK0_9ACTN|nr:hypothetical protein STSP_38250 [Streptomyces jeddahensis]